MKRRLLVLILGMALSGGCGGDGSDGSGGGDAGSGDPTSACDDCPPGTSCVFDECVSERDGHWDCGGGASCMGGEIVVYPVGDAPDAEDPCAPSVITCEHGCDEMVEVDPGNPESACLPAPCSPEAHGLEGTPVDFEPLQFTCAPVEDQGQETEELETEVVIATSAEEVLDLLALVMTCVDAPVLDVDFTTHRVAVLKGTMEQDAPSVHWVVESGGTIWVDLRVPPPAGGALPPVVPYALFIVLPASDTPVEGKVCALPLGEGRAMP